MSPALRFRFSLETVLHVRTIREEQARWELAQAELQLQKSRLALADTEQRREGLLAELKEASSRQWDIREYQTYHYYLEHLQSAILGWKEQIAQGETVIAEKRRLLHQRHQERRLLEGLREKKLAEHRREVMRILEKETEAITLGRWQDQERRDDVTL